MPKRTTVVLEDDSYKKLVEESIKRYGTARAISKVIDSLVEESVKQPSKDDDILKLLYSKKVAKTTTKEFEKERRKLSARLESRS
ncbi:MAG: hypothetical protein JRN52_04560 [Nitrososphaerota archaeon]|nr:hypothetical protein [Nitrososphaerota archaeon]